MQAGGRALIVGSVSSSSSSFEEDGRRDFRRDDLTPGRVRLGRSAKEPLCRWWTLRQDVRRGALCRLRLSLQRIEKSREPPGRFGLRGNSGPLMSPGAKQQRRLLMSHTSTVSSFAGSMPSRFKLLCARSLAFAADFASRSRAMRAGS